MSHKCLNKRRTAHDRRHSCHAPEEKLNILIFCHTRIMDWETSTDYIILFFTIKQTVRSSHKKKIKKDKT